MLTRLLLILGFGAVRAVDEHLHRKSLSEADRRQYDYEKQRAVREEWTGCLKGIFLTLAIPAGIIGFCFAVGAIARAFPALGPDAAWWIVPGITSLGMLMRGRQITKLKREMPTTYAADDPGGWYFWGLVFGAFTVWALAAAGQADKQ